jgi:glycosyltransferase involved in cell wall biosynthesis
MKRPTISAAVRAYNAEEHIGETLTAILSQTRPPDEVVVVDDGSTDGTADELERFRGEVRVVRQANGGYAGAFNRSFEEARGDYVANCDADDVWEPDKMERQLDALLVHPEIDIAFAGARLFGLKEGPFNPGPAVTGLLDSRDFARHLYRGNPICTSSTVVRRSLFARVGPFRHSAAPSEDYDYWLRALLASATFFHEPSFLVRYRVHSEQVSSDLLRMRRAEYRAHCRHSALAGDDQHLVRTVRAGDLSNLARALWEQGSPREARAHFASSFRQRRSPRTLAWVLALSAPDRCRRPLVDGLASLKRLAGAGGEGQFATRSAP